MASYLRCYAPHDLDALIALHAPEVVFTDHRKLGWETIRGQDEARRFHSSVLEFSPDFWGEVDEVIACDDRVIALRSTWRGSGGETGGMHETTLGHVVLVTWSLRHLGPVRGRRYRPMLARYRELGGHLSPERIMAEYLRKVELSDIRGLEAMVDPEVSVADHRALGDRPVKVPARRSDLCSRRWLSPASCVSRSSGSSRRTSTRWHAPELGSGGRPKARGS